MGNCIGEFPFIVSASIEHRMQLFDVTLGVNVTETISDVFTTLFWKKTVASAQEKENDLDDCSSKWTET